MDHKPTYEELEQRVKGLEEKVKKVGRLFDVDITDREGLSADVREWVYIAELSLNIAKSKQEQETLQRERDLLQSIMNGAGHAQLVYLDRDFNFVRVNQSYAEGCGYRPEEMIGKNHFDLYPNPEDEVLFARVRDTGEDCEVHDRPFTYPDQPERGVTYWDWTLKAVKDSEGQVIGLVASLYETTERVRNREVLNRTVTELQQALAKVRTLSGFLPICASCKKIRDDSGYWEQIETYLKEHSDAEFSHGLCPECAAKLYPELMKRS